MRNLRPLNALVALLVATIGLGLALLSGVQSIAAEEFCGARPGLGDRLIVKQSDQDVVVEILPSTATFMNTLHLVSPRSERIGDLPWQEPSGTAHNRDVGRKVNLGRFAVGTELVFRLDVSRRTGFDDLMEDGTNRYSGVDTGLVYPKPLPFEYPIFTGSGDQDPYRNVSERPAPMAHAIVESTGNPAAVQVRFEDTLRQDNRNDCNFLNARFSVTLGVPNVPPRLIINGSPVVVDEGQLATNGGTYTDDNPGDNVVISASSGAVTKTGTSSGTWSWTFQTVDGPAQTRPVTITADDGRGGRADATFPLTVRNVPPTVIPPAVVPEPSDEGGGVVASATFSDPAGAADAPYSCTVNYGDGSGDLPGSVSGFTCTGPAHTYVDNRPADAPYAVTIKVTDKDGGTGSNTAPHGVKNVAPRISSLSANPAVINENDTTTLTGTITDPGVLDDFTLTINWGDGTGPQSLPLAAGTTSFSVAHQYLDDNPTGTPVDVNAVTVTLTDKDGGIGTAATSVTVNNLAPVLTITAPEPGTLYAVTSATINLASTFSDIGTQDTHSCAIVWDDGATTAGTVNEANGSGGCIASHTFTAAGVYTIQVTVTDDDGGTDTESTFVVVYDPSAGFVTGGGFIDSPMGAYKPDPALTGKANFGFVSKYQKGATVPTGQTEFQFKAGDLNFHSESYEYLVVSGARAQYKGVGSVNGMDGYRFIMTVTDGQLSGGGGQDKLRMRIWAPDGGLVYDNGTVNNEDIDLSDQQAISGGSIVIHR